MLSGAWRRVVVPRLALGMSLLTGACATQRPGSLEPEDGINPRRPPDQSLHVGPDPDKLTITTDDQVVLTAAQQAEHAQLRQRMLAEARHDFPKLAALAETSYSGELQGLHMRLTQYLVASANPVNSGVAYVDPAKFDVGMALGFQVPEAIKLILAQDGVRPSAETLSGAAESMAAPFHFRLQNVDVFTQAPHAMFNTRRDRADACVVVPSSAFALTVDIQGLTTPQQVQFTNRHESWHCLDHFFVEQSLDAKEVAAVPPGTLAQNIGNRTAMEIYAIGYNKESLADVGAVGDMIRHDGYGLDLVHTIAQWRQRYPEDVQHMSAPALNGFRAKVERMGLETFRAMTEEQATNLYVDTVREYGMTPRSLYMQVKYELSTPEERRATADLARTDNDAWRATNLLQYYLGKANEAPAGPLSPREQLLMERLSNFNAGGILEQHAFDMAGRVTPRSLVEAYGDLQRSFQNQLNTGHADPLVTAQMGKLQQTFIYQMRHTDYVEANSRRGVDITAPALSASRSGMRRGGTSLAAPGL